MRCLWICLYAPIALVMAVACEDKKGPADSTRAEAGAGTDKYATADPKLEKALRAATSASAADNGGAPAAGGFAPGASDPRHPQATPPKIRPDDVGSDTPLLH